MTVSPSFIPLHDNVYLNSSTGLSLPPTFQSWFTITNLHVWMAIVRLRALPSSHGRHFVQALIDHFFFDVEDRLRAILGKSAPERLVTRQMKVRFFFG